MAAPLPEVSAKELLALVPPTYLIKSFPISVPGSNTLKHVKTADLSNLGLEVRLCIAGSPGETAAERAVDRQIHCMLAVGGAWHRYLGKRSDDRFAVARSIYAYAMGSLDRAGAAVVGRALRDQLPMVDSIWAPVGFSKPDPKATTPYTKLLASSDAPVSGLAAIRAVRDWYGANLATTVNRAVMSPAGWDDPINQGQGDDGFSFGQFGNNAYFTKTRKFAVVSNTGMCLHDLTERSQMVNIAGDACMDLVLDSWRSYRQFGNRADYDRALLVMRFAYSKIGGHWNARWWLEDGLKSTP